MKAMILPRVAHLEECPRPLELVDWPEPQPKPHEVLIQVSVCGVCHTELDEIEGRTAPPRLPVIPGHQIVGRVARLGDEVRRWNVGDRVGVGWIHSSTGKIDENLSSEFSATGRDVHGGYAEYMTVPERYCYAIPEIYRDELAAPLMCAGGIGFRSLRLAGISDGERLGLTGFGGSAHLVLQLAKHLYPRSPIYVFARDAAAREFALKLGADWAGDTSDDPPASLHAIIDTTPAWKPVVEALRSLRPQGRLVINAIRKEDTDKDYLLRLNYHEHLWMEKEIKSVANITHFDLAEFLPLAAQIPLMPEVQLYPLQQANEALYALKTGAVKGAKVLVIAE